MRILNLLIIFVFLFGCSNNESSKPEAAPKPKKKRPVSVELGKFFDVDGKKMLYGGEDESNHFDITGYELKDDQFHYGIGREKFPALLEPNFTSIQDADSFWVDSSRFLVAYSGDEVKAYSVKDLTRHEVVNDVLNGEPIMAVYCILADLGGIYERTYGDDVLTFALSGYTYYDEQVWDGLDGFILWDRETESLWWPLIDRAVSGPLQGVKLLEMNKAHWEDTTWGDLKKKYPQAAILKTGQDFERPESWTKIKDVSQIVEKFSAQ